jgi:hypothetical protein
MATLARTCMAYGGPSPRCPPYCFARVSAWAMIANCLVKIKSGGLAAAGAFSKAPDRPNRRSQWHRATTEQWEPQPDDAAMEVLWGPFLFASVAVGTPVTGRLVDCRFVSCRYRSVAQCRLRRLCDVSHVQWVLFLSISLLVADAIKGQLKFAFGRT